MTRLRAVAIHKRFGAVQALRGVELEAGPGEVHAVIGENGAGKSTLMNVLAGIFRPDAGKLWLDGEVYAPGSPASARAAGVAIVHQEPQICPHLTVAENVLLGREPRKGLLIDRKRMRAQCEAALSSLQRGRIEPDALAMTLSPGDRQMVAIARAAFQERGSTRVLIVDEPTSSLAAGDVERMFEAITQLRADGVTILYISHFLEEVQRIADRFTVLRDGESVGSGAIADTTIDEIVSLMVGRNVDELFTRSKRDPGEVVLDVTRLAGSVLPHSASFQLRRGEVLGVAGLVGSGRTELVRALFGLDAVRSGSVRLAAVGRGDAATPAQRLSAGVGMLSEDRAHEGLASSMSIADNLTLSKLRGLGPRGLVWPAKQRQVAAQWIDKLGIRCSDSGQSVSALSGGNQQKVAIARLLYHDVDVLLLDEPTRGIDIASRADVYRLIDELTQQGKAVLLVSSYLPELFGVCDRIAVMHRGRLGEARPTVELDQHTVLAEATGA